MKKLTFEEKTKLAFSIEYIVIALIALVIGVLKLIGVIPTKPVRLLVYNIISMAGAVYMIADMIWYACSEKKRKRTAIIDKVLASPAFLYLMGFDIYCFIYYGRADDMLVRYSIGIVLIYVAVIYIFLGIYHYKHPSPQIVQAIKDIEEAKRLEQEEKELEAKQAELEKQKSELEELNKQIEAIENKEEEK